MPYRLNATGPSNNSMVWQDLALEQADTQIGESN